MKKYLAAFLTVGLLLSGCGYAGLDGEMIGQAKKITKVTPLICPDFTAFDISLGVMQNGTGSMSGQDLWLKVDGADLAVLKRAVDTAAIVRVKYDTKRMAICTPAAILRHVEIVGIG